MNFIIIRKKHIFIICALLIICFTFIFFYIHKNTYNIASISTNSTIFDASNLQEKIDSIYTSKEKIAYLTFDDGPTKIATPKILDTLKENNINASFFVIGYRVNEFPDIVKRAYNEGNFIANHGYTHKNNKLYQNKNSFINEILNTDKAISSAIGIDDYHSHIFRFPNGSISSSYSGAKKNCKNYLKEIGYAYIDWNALNNDSIKKYSSYELLNNLKKTCEGKNSLVILMHDTSDVSKSYESLDDSIKYLKEQGYTFRTFYDFLRK